MSIINEFLLIACFTGACLAVQSDFANNPKAFQAIGKSGLSLHAKSAQHCVQLCDNHNQCDAANYHTVSGKCRILLRCTSYRLVESNIHQHFSKRPAIIEKGYMYDDSSDSCLKVMDKLTDYQEADKACRNMEGRLVALTAPETNRIATKLLKDAGKQYAWIGLTDNLQEGDPTHSSGDRVSQTGFFPRAKQGHRNDPTRNCWSLTDSGEWTEQSCKERKQVSICQITSF